jgi:hypothetical protein
MVAVIDETETDLRALSERDLGPLLPPADSQLVLLDWLNFPARTARHCSFGALGSAEKPGSQAGLEGISAHAQTCPWIRPGK